MKLERKGDFVYVTGVINENSDFTPLLAEASPLKLDLSGVDRINSIGVRSWLKFLAQWGDTKTIEYWNCSTVIADQICIITSLRGIKSRIATVKSALLPTECVSCGIEGEMLISDEMFRKNPKLVDSLGTCSKCQGSIVSAISDFASLFK